MNLFAPTQQDDVNDRFHYWQIRILITSTLGYALFYFVRKNLSVAMPVMEQTLGITKSQLGLFLTLHGVVYGVSKFVNGFLGDRWNARWFLGASLALCAITNWLFGMSTTVVTMGLLWILNGFFQGAGSPPCTHLMAHWFAPKELASKMSIWNTSHSIGACSIVVLCGYLVMHDWRLCFFVPAAISLFGSLVIMVLLRDTPESLGLPPVAGTDSSTGTRDQRTIAELVFRNPYIWILSIGQFFVYTVRYGILDWGPTFLKQARHIDLTSASWMVAAFEGCGVLGMLSSGWLTDHLFGGRAARTCIFYMLFCMVALFFFWHMPNASVPMSTLLLCTSGFFVYGPQALVGVACINLATKRAAATAVGLTGIFAYLSTVISGVGVGWLVDHHGWDSGFLVFVFAGLIGTLLFSLCWTAPVHCYLEEDVHAK